MSASRRVFTVNEIATRVRRLLEGEVGRVWVEGECSNVSTPNSGHIYFTLKDDQSQLQAAWFRGRRRNGDPLPRDGMKLRAYGMITAYERSSQFQILVETVEDAGRGDLRKRFDELKEKLRAEGLFDSERKRPLPLLPRRIGVITSPTGAAIRDILNVLARRYPDREILIAPVPVQGDAAAGSIARAIGYFGREGTVDVLIVGRGGGSLEDLWGFNEEVVARAIADCPLPVISAVGHETDFTIADFAADVRAPTPSAAAELVIGRKQDFEEQVRRLEQRLSGALDRRRLRLRDRLSHMRAHRLFHEPAHLVRGHRQHVSRLRDRMHRVLQRRLAEPRQEVAELRLGLRHHLERSLRDTQRHLDDLDTARQRLLEERLRDSRHRLEAQQRQLKAFNPYEVLRRGFSITRTVDGRVLDSIDALESGNTLETLLRDGRLLSTLDRKESREEN